jgi:hypothetical protein
MKARISQLHKTEAEWLKFSNWTPHAGEIIVYDPDESHPYTRIKVGDEQRTLGELDFFIESSIEERLKQVRFEDTIDGGCITEYID